MKKFSLSTVAPEISTILDVESDVSRFYAELVPLSIKPEEFWARFALSLTLSLAFVLLFHALIHNHA